MVVLLANANPPALGSVDDFSKSSGLALKKNVAVLSRVHGDIFPDGFYCHGTSQPLRR